MTKQQIFETAKQYIPGGVNSPVRSFNSVGGTPFFTARAKDCFLFDSDGKQYIDYVCSWGANIVGHAHPEVIASVSTALQNGFSYGTPTELEVEFAKTVIVNKRSMKPGYAGIENDLFFQPKTSMLFGDAKKVLQDLCAEVKSV